MKNSLALTAVGLLAFTLVACGGGDNAENTAHPAADENRAVEHEPTAGEPEPADPGTSEATAADQDSPVDGHTAGGPQPVAFGETITDTCDTKSSCDVDITINEITLSDECHRGLNSYSVGNEDGDATFVKVIGALDVREYSTDYYYSVGESDWAPVDAEGRILEVRPALSCETKGQARWDAGVNVGFTGLVDQEYAVDGVPVKWVLAPEENPSESWEWDIA